MYSYGITSITSKYPWEILEEGMSIMNYISKTWITKSNQFVYWVENEWNQSSFTKTLLLKLKTCKSLISLDDSTVALPFCPCNRVKFDFFSTLNLKEHAFNYSKTKLKQNVFTHLWLPPHFYKVSLAAFCSEMNNKVEFFQHRNNKYTKCRELASINDLFKNYFWVFVQQGFTFRVTWSVNIAVTLEVKTVFPLLMSSRKFRWYNLLLNIYNISICFLYSIFIT